MKNKIIDFTKPQLVNFGKIGSGDLGFITVAENLNFMVNRVYWTYCTPHNIVRGNHAHKKLQQIVFALSGEITFELEDISGQKNKFILDNPENGLFIPQLHWRTIQFTHSAILLCLASNVFDENDYIRDYKDFIKER